MISGHDWWLWTKPGYITDPDTKQQSMEWRHSGLPFPKNSECKISLEKFSPRFFEIKTASSPLIIFQRARLSTRRITHLCWCNWRTLWRKKPWEAHQVDLVLARQCPGSPVTCNPEETGLPGLPMSWLPTLFSGSAPSDYHLFIGLKKQLKGGHLSSDAEVIAVETCLDGQPSVFWVACKRWRNGLRSVLSFVGSMLNKSRVCSL